jgi:hypothetical protein
VKTFMAVIFCAIGVQSLLKCELLARTTVTSQLLDKELWVCREEHGLAIGGIHYFVCVSISTALVSWPHVVGWDGSASGFANTPQ